MSSVIITVESGLAVLAQLLGLVQSAYSTGAPIDAAAWNAVISSTATDMKKLDDDLASL